MDPLETNLSHLNHFELIGTAQNIIELGAAHPGLQDVPADVTGPTVLSEIKVDYAGSVVTAGNGDKIQGAFRDAKRVELLEGLIMWGQFIVMRSKRRKDPSLLQNNGFELKKTRTKIARADAVTPVPTDVRLKHSSRSTYITLITRAMQGKGSFEVRWTTNPNDESSWVDGGHHSYCQIELGGFIPGTKYYFCIRYHGKNGTSDWSDPVSIIAL
jgi:hypothetical protein